MPSRDKKKRNHYVPRLVLRNFSSDGRTIAVLLVSPGRRITRASLRDQCYVDYFYGRDAKVENEFAAQEAAISALLMSVDHGRVENLRAEDLALIGAFVFEQRQRTVAAAQAVHDSNAAMMRAILEYGLRMPDDERRAFEEEQRAPQRLALEAAAAMSSFVSDLEVKFLLTPSRGRDRPARAFVISDAAVASYNQWAEHHPRFQAYSGYKAIASKGLQWFYPFAPDLCICVYDPTTYQYGSQDRRICTASVRDVRLLNALQAIHAVNCVYYLASRTHDEELDELCRTRSSHEPLRLPIRSDGPVWQRPDGTSAQIVGWSSPDARIAARFQFVRVIDASAYDGYDRAIIPVRQPELLEAHSRDIRGMLNVERWR